LAAKIAAFILHFVSLGLSTYLNLRKERDKTALLQAPKKRPVSRKTVDETLPGSSNVGSA
jgi:hypothetical protein